MNERVKNFIKYITDNFPGPFMNYMREQIQTSQLQNSSLYEITKLAFSATNLDELYKSIIIACTFAPWINYDIKRSEIVHQLLF